MAVPNIHLMLDLETTLKLSVKEDHHMKIQWPLHHTPVQQPHQLLNLHDLHTRPKIQKHQHRHPEESSVHQPSHLNIAKA
jgi:hypothetical protein